jgi:hypothetical protein
MHSLHSIVIYTLVRFMNAHFTLTTTITIVYAVRSMCAHWRSVVAFVDDEKTQITVLTVSIRVDST